MIILNVKKQTAMWIITAFVVGILFNSCKRRDDYPKFEAIEEEVDEEVIPKDDVMSAITKVISNNTNLIGTFQMDSTTKLDDGFEHTHIRFLNKVDEPISLHIMEVDLSSPNISALALSPYNDILFSTQYLAEMAEFNERRAEGKLLAAINGDVNTSTQPTGSFIWFGKKLKTTSTTETSNTRPFFGVKKDGAYFVGNRPSDEVAFDSYNLDEIEHLVSGANWLLYKGEQINYTTETVIARTAIGLSFNAQKVYCIVVDGGLPSFSIGISLNDLGEMMKAIGAVDAFYTNGNTSSSLVLRTENRDKKAIWELKNRPSNKLGTPVVNGIGFLLKK